MSSRIFDCNSHCDDSDSLHSGVLIDADVVGNRDITSLFDASDACCGGSDAGGEADSVEIAESSEIGVIFISLVAFASGETNSADESNGGISLFGRAINLFVVRNGSCVHSWFQSSPNLREIAFLMRKKKLKQKLDLFPLAISSRFLTHYSYRSNIQSINFERTFDCLSMCAGSNGL